MRQIVYRMHVPAQIVRGSGQEWEKVALHVEVLGPSDRDHWPEGFALDFEVADLDLDGAASIRLDYDQFVTALQMVRGF